MQCVLILRAGKMSEPPRAQTPEALTPEETEDLYRKYHSSTVYRSDWVISILVLCMSSISISSFLDFWPKASAALVIAVACVIGQGPILVLSLRQTAFYIEWREWFVLNSMFWSLLRFLYFLGTIVPSPDTPEISHFRFIFKALIKGPHIAVLLLGVGYPLRVQASFPCTCLTGILAFVCASFVHSELLVSAAALPHLEALDRYLCSGCYGDFVLLTTGVPCSTDNVLLNLWGAESGAAVFALFLFTVRQESLRRKLFFVISGLQEPYPVFWENLWHSVGLTLVSSAGIVGLHLIFYCLFPDL